jgi:regulatory protein
MVWAFLDPVDGALAATLMAKPVTTLRARALRYLALREHSRQELRGKLAPHALEGDDLEALLDDLAARGWLSEVRWESTARAKSRRFGPLKVAQLLRARGLGDEIIAAGLRAAGTDGAGSIEAIWRSRFRHTPVDEREKARQVRFLQGRGFPLDEIFRFLKTMEGSP